MNRPDGGGERGMVTAELAVALPALIAVLMLAVGALALTLDQVRCVDAARTGARAAARGESTAATVAAASPLAPSGSQIEVAAGVEVSVRVTAPHRAWARWLPANMTPSATANMPAEVASPAGPALAPGAP